jgi:hypothetical protein
MEAPLTPIKFRNLVFLAVALTLTVAAGQAHAAGRCVAGHTSPDERLYQLHNDSTIWVKNDQSCAGKGLNCLGGWDLLDKNSATTQIASYCELYQMHNDGAIWHYTGDFSPQQICISTPCPFWEQLDANPQTKTIATSAPYGNLNDTAALYQMHKDGSIWHRNAKPCNKIPQCFGGWDIIDNNPSTTSMVGGFNGLYQLHNDGKVYRWNGTNCGPGSAGCPGWTLIDQSSDPTVMISAGNGLYQLRKSGAMLHYDNRNTQCTSAPCPGWTPVGQDAATVMIKAGFPNFYRLQNNGQVLELVRGTWQALDAHPDTIAITAGRLLYEVRKGGNIFRYNESLCPPSTVGCPTAFDQLDQNASSEGVVVNGNLALH